MGAKEEFIEATNVNSKTIYFTVKKNGLLKKETKMKFIIKPLLPKDLLSENLRDELMKEMATGQSVDEASRIVAEKLKKKFFEVSNEEFLKELLGKILIYPKLVDKEENLTEDELPYSLLKPHWDIKNFIIQEMIKISPIFQG